MSAPTYESYKESHVAELGPIPAAWRLSRLGYETWVRARLGWKGLKADEYVDDGYAMLATPNIKNRNIDFDGANRITQERYDESPEIKIAQGDILLAKDGSTLGTVNIVRSLPCAATVNSSIAVITPHRQCASLFLFFYFQSNFVRSRIDQLKGGMGVPHLFQDDLNRFPLPLPPLDDQIDIAAFLDRETGRIDALVEAQQRLIELLKEKRQAAISHAVTKGLDPAAPMKDTGVEWLGQVPAHWSIKKLGSLCSKIGSGKTPSGGADAYVEAGIAFLRSQNVYDEGLWLDEMVYISEAIDEGMSNTRVQPGDILLNITGASLGRTCIVPEPFEPANVNQHVCIIRLHGVAQRGFVSMAMKSTSTKCQIDATQNGAAREGLNFQQIAGLWIALPPESEALDIVNAVCAKTGALDRLTEQAEAAIALLQERRDALISAAVTGKIDVRGLVPEQAEAA